MQTSDSLGTKSESSKHDLRKTSFHGSIFPELSSTQILDQSLRFLTLSHSANGSVQIFELRAQSFFFFIQACTFFVIKSDSSLLVGRGGGAVTNSCVSRQHVKKRRIVCAGETETEIAVANCSVASLSRYEL